MILMQQYLLGEGFFLNHIDSFVFPIVNFSEQSICFQLGTILRIELVKEKCCMI